MIFVIFTEKRPPTIPVNAGIEIRESPDPQYSRGSASFPEWRIAYSSYAAHSRVNPQNSPATVSSVQAHHEGEPIKKW